MAPRLVDLAAQRRRLRGLWHRHPRGGLAIRTAVAAGLAWAVVQLIPGASEYPYYAPLGAVVATSVTVVSSLKESLRASLAIILGALLAFVVEFVFDPGVVMVVCVVAAGVLLAGWKLLGDLGTWVPTAALFVLIVGEKDPVRYFASYGGLILLGGLIGTLVAVVFPQLPLSPVDRAIVRLRYALIDQLDQLAEGLDSDRAPSRAEWDDRYRPLDSLQWTVSDLLHRAEESRRWNTRVRRHREQLERISRHARGLNRAAWLVQDITEIIIEDELGESDALGLGQQFRPPVTQVLRALADVLRSIDDQGAGSDELTTAQQQLDLLVRDVGANRVESEDGMYVVSNVVNSTRRILRTLAPTG